MDLFLVLLLLRSAVLLKVHLQPGHSLRSPLLQSSFCIIQLSN